LAPCLNRDLEINPNLAIQGSPQQTANEIHTVEHLLLALLDNHAAHRCVAWPCGADMERLPARTEPILSTPRPPFFPKQDHERETQPHAKLPARNYSAHVFHVAELWKGRSQRPPMFLVAISASRIEPAGFFLNSSRSPRIDYRKLLPHGISKGRRRHRERATLTRTMWMMKAAKAVRTPIRWILMPAI